MAGDYRIVVHRRVAKYLRRQGAPDRKRVKKALADLRPNPLGSPAVKTMRGRWEGYARLRVGELRVVFWIDDAERTVYVDHVGPRGDIYK